MRACTSCGSTQHIPRATATRQSSSCSTPSAAQNSAELAHRRSLLAAGSVAALLLRHRTPPAQAHESSPASPTVIGQGEIDYTSSGPYQTLRLPRLEHTCSKCFPACTGSKCLLRLDVHYPKRKTTAEPGFPFPLAVFTSGFLVASASYTSYAERLASWGWVTVLYDKVETAMDNLDDILSVNMISEIIDWAKADPLLGRIADPNCTFLCGHSRGGKLSVLAAARDERVKAVFLLDPVDNTVYAPLGPGYPSGVQALASLGAGRQPVPLAVIGSGLGGDCVPEAANFRLFYKACTAASLQVPLQDVGHFQFLDSQSLMQRSICAVGHVSDAAVQRISQAVMVAWGELMVRQRYVQQSVDGRSDALILTLQQKQAAIEQLQQYASQVLQQDSDTRKAQAKKGKPALPVQPIQFAMKNLT